MTNAEKFLKDGVDIENFTNSLCRFVENWELRNGIKNFLKKEVKPTLTEDERVILRNIPTDIYQKIYRDCDGFLSITGERSYNGLFIYNHIFKFIEPRRGVRDKGVVGK